MTGIINWLDLMPDTVTHFKLLKRDDYGKQIYGFGTTYRARVVYEQKDVRNDQGNIVVSNGQIWLNSNVNVNPQDKITLPNGLSPPVISVSRPSDEVGVHHTKIYFG